MSGRPANSRRIAGAALLLSQLSTVLGRCAPARAWCRARSSGRIWPVSSPRSWSRRRLTVQRAHRPAWMRPDWPQWGQLRQNSASGRVQVEQSGSSRVPPRTGRTCPHPAQQLQRCLQARHHGFPVALEIRQGASRPQMLQVSVFQGRQFSQSGPPGVRTATGRRRPHSRQVSWLTVSVIRQLGHNGSPCSSRVAASLMAPQRAHGCARDLATQLRHSHCPPIRRCRRISRSQRGQTGRVIACAPASQSASINRSTDASCACAPAPVSNSGRWASAQAS